MDRIGIVSTYAYLFTNGLLACKSCAMGICMYLVIIFGGLPQYVWAQTEPFAIQGGNELAIHLDQASLKDALILLEEKSGISIVFNEQYLPERILSGKFAGAEVEEVLEKLLFASSLRVVRTGDYQIVIAPEEKGRQRKSRTTEVQGIVRDKHEAIPLVGATVYSKRTQKGVVTDQTGQFSLKEIAVDQLHNDTLVVQFVGYETLDIPAADVRPDQVIVAELALQSITLDEVQVTAERAQDGISIESAASQYRIRPRDLEWIPGASDNSMIRALQLLPGISGGQDGRSELLIRGGTAFQHLFSLNGITLYNTNHLFGFTSAVNEEIIGSLELYKGGFPARYGGRISGVIEASGEPGNTERFQASVGINGLQASGKVSFPLAGKGAIQVAYRRSFNDLVETRFYRKLLNSSLSRTREEDGSVYVSPPPDQLEFQDVYTHAHWPLDEKSTVNATLYHSDDAFNYLYYDPTLNISENVDDPFFVEYDDENSVSANTLGFSSSISRNWHRGARVEAAFSYTRFSNAFNYFTTFSAFDYFEQKNNFNENKLNDYAFRVQSVIPIGNRLVADFGGWINDTRVAYSYQYEDEFGTFEEKALIRGGYAQAHLEIRPGVLITPGVRLTSYTLLPGTYIEPRFRIQYELDDKVQLKAAFGTYYQFIDRLDHLDILDDASEFWALAQDEIQPTRSIHRIVGLRWGDSSRFFDIEFFSNMLSGVSEFGQMAEGNLLTDTGNELFVDGSGVQQGFEILVQQTAGPIRGWASYAYTQSERQIDGRNRDEWYPTNADFRHASSVVAQYTLGRWQWSLSWQLSSGQPYTQIYEEIISPDPFEPDKVQDDEDYDRLLFSGPINGRRLQPGHRMDVAMKRSFLLNNVLLDVGVTVFNVYNYRSVWRRDYNQYAVPLQSIEYLSPGITPTFTFRVSYL